MKNQYIGDIGDYGKYGMLRYLADKGIKIGVNWYLTSDDVTNDGKFTQYLKDYKESFRDKILFDFLSGIAFDENKNIGMVEKSGIIPGAVFFSEIVSKEDRAGWHKKAMDALSDAELVFCDPDNGPIGSKTFKSKDADKFVSPKEIESYYRDNKNVVYYCQRGRRDYYSWYKTKNEMRGLIPESKIITLTFHKGTQRSYIFVVHPEDYKQYVRWIEDFTRNSWGRNGWFTIENQYDPAKKHEDTVGNYLKIEMLDKSCVELRILDDGKIEIRDSRKPGMIAIMRPEDFVSSFIW